MTVGNDSEIVAVRKGGFDGGTGGAFPYEGFEGEGLKIRTIEFFVRGAACQCHQQAETDE